MKIGYNTNGFAFHDPLTAIDILGEIGYQSVAISVDQHFLNPFHEQFESNLDAVRKRLEKWSLNSVIETGARFLLDPRRKHHPTLLSFSESDREVRIDFLVRCLSIAEVLGSDCVSLWSGVADDFCDSQTALDRLSESLRPVLAEAERKQIDLGFEPEPGMFVETTGCYERLCRWVESDRLKLTMDIGHLFCLGEVPIVDFIVRMEDSICNIHIEDMKSGVHEHLAFGDGDISFAPIIKALDEIDYSGGLHIELSRHSHNAVETAKGSFQFLHELVEHQKQNSSRKSS